MDLLDFKDLIVIKVAMALTVAGLAASGRTVVHGAECASVSWPTFYERFETWLGPFGRWERGPA